MTELEARLDQNEKEIALLLEEQNNLKTQIEASKVIKEDLPLVGIVKLGNSDSRIFINFAKMTDSTCDGVWNAITNKTWVTFCRDGQMGVVGKKDRTISKVYDGMKIFHNIAELLRKED